jgi:Putative peptidoglycan binding domain
MRLIKGSLARLVLAGILAVAPTAAFAHGGGGGGHAGGGGHFAGGGGHFAGGGGHFAGGGRHVARGSAGHRSATHEGAHFAAHGWHGGHYGYGGGYWGGGPFWGWGWDGDPYPYDGYYDYNEGDYSNAQTSPSEVARSEQTIVAVQNELKKLGYYHGQTDGIAGPETRKAVSWFQSVDKLSVTGRIDNPTLKALQIS